VKPAYAYRFDYKGRSVVITGDTTADPRLVTAAQGADLFVSEGLNREMIAEMEQIARGGQRDRIAHIMNDIQSYHISPREAAGIARQAGAKLLVLYHLLPAPDNALARRIFTRGLSGDWSLAQDGSLYTLPVGSEDIQIGKVGE
jgi:ribonuclease Z